MKIAIAAEGKQLSGHFGHCSQFHIYEISDNKAVFVESITPPPHEPGLIPQWLSGYKIETVLTGGMGRKAKEIFDEKNIKVIDGIEIDDINKIAVSFAKGTMKKGSSTCDH
ncbi:MAG: NifB/NifX family molybdenum-iron cluster-binding protein [bacterium]